MKKATLNLRNITLAVLSLSLIFVSCSKKDDSSSVPVAAFAGQYLVVDDNETYILKIESTGGSNFQIREFGGFLNVPVKAVAEGKTLKIASQTFNNPNGNSITITGNGSLTSKNTTDDAVSFQYTVSGFADYSGEFTGVRQ
jgi:hypothetical protein